MNPHLTIKELRTALDAAKFQDAPITIWTPDGDLVTPVTLLVGEISIPALSWDEAHGRYVLHTTRKPELEDFSNV